MKISKFKTNKSKHFRSRSKKNIFGKFNKKFSIFKKKSYSIIFFLILFLVIIIIGFNVLLKFTFLAPKNEILFISFTFRTVSKTDNPEMFRFIKSELVGQNYFVTKYLKKGKYLKNLKEKYNIIKSWDLFLLEDNKIAVDISFHEPKLIFKDKLGFRGTYQGKFFEIFSGSLFLSGKILINLPDYTTQNKTMNGFFYKISEEKLTFQIEEITNFLGKENIENITYLPGGAKTIIKLNNGIKLYLSNDKKISEQIKNYLILKQDYLDFEKITEIDLGSLNDPIIKIGR